jgi:hypothetical protein
VAGTIGPVAILSALPTLGGQAFPFIYEFGNPVSAKAQSAVGEPDCRQIWRSPRGVIPHPVWADLGPLCDVLSIEQAIVQDYGVFRRKWRTSFRVDQLRAKIDLKVHFHTGTVMPTSLMAERPGEQNYLPTYSFFGMEDGEVLMIGGNITGLLRARQVTRIVGTTYAPTLRIAARRTSEARRHCMTSKPVV